MFFTEPPVFSSFPPVVETLKNTEVSLECELSGTPPFEVVWDKDKRQLRSSKKYKIASKNFHASIHILNVESTDIGEYHCKAQNEVGSDTCVCAIKLKGKHSFCARQKYQAFTKFCVLSLPLPGKPLEQSPFIFSCSEPPKFISKLSSLTVVAGEPAELQASIEGAQPISVQWLKEKEVIRESENIRISFVDNVATLQFVKAEPANAGKYICQVKNDGGMRENMATLTVLGTTVPC